MASIRRGVRGGETSERREETSVRGAEAKNLVSSPRSHISPCLPPLRKPATQAIENLDKLRPDGPLALNADFTFYTTLELETRFFNGYQFSADVSEKMGP